MTVRHVAVVGSGRLARSLVASLATTAPADRPPAHVTLLARDRTVAQALAVAAQVRAAVTGVAVTFAAQECTDEVRTMAQLQPDLVVCCASAQSPYERLEHPSPWTDLVARAGFGLTLPFQASVVLRLARALAAVSPATKLVNGCFPDAVNPLLAALDLPVLCGIGNVATLAAGVQSALGQPDQRGLAVLGHHVQLATPAGAGEEALVWLDGARVAGVTALLAPVRALPRTELNGLAGHAAARLVADLLAGVEVLTNLPGPLGLPGGYPVRVGSDGNIELNLPAGLRREVAVDWNVRAGHRDGVEVRDGRVTYPPLAAAELARHAPALAAGWPVTAVDAVTDQLSVLRQRLRLAQPVAV